MLPLNLKTTLDPDILGEVQFENLSEFADDFEWDLGDGTITKDFAPYHEYDTNRFVQVLLVAFNYNERCFYLRRHHNPIN